MEDLNNNYIYLAIFKEQEYFQILLFVPAKSVLSMTIERVYGPIKVVSSIKPNLEIMISIRKFEVMPKCWRSIINRC